MPFIQTIPAEQAQGLLKDLYESDEKTFGHLPGFAMLFSLNPDAYAAWKKLIGSVRSRMRLRRYELLTLATALAIRCTY